MRQGSSAESRVSGVVLSEEPGGGIQNSGSIVVQSDPQGQMDRSLQSVEERAASF